MGQGKNFPEQLFQLSICLIRALPLCWSTDRHITDPFPCAGVSAEHSTPLSTPVMYWQNPECSIEGSNKADTKIYGTLKTGWGWNCHNSSRGFKITFKIDSNRAELEKYFSHKLRVVKTKSWYIKIPWNKQWLTTMLILLQQASLLRGLGSLNQSGCGCLITSVFIPP